MQRRIIISLLLLFPACQPKSKGESGQVEPPPTATPADVEPSEVVGEPPFEAREPTPVPEYLSEVRGLIEIGGTALARKQVDELMAAHPDDPWVLADAGYVKELYYKGGEGQELLARALELAEDASLRAQIKFYQARLVQWREGLRATQAKELLVSSLAEFPLAPAKRLLDLIDGSKLSDDPRIRDACAARLRTVDDERGDWSCAGVDVDGTLWLRLSCMRPDGTEVSIFHEWRLAEPKPREASTLRDFDVHEDSPMEDISICRGDEKVYVHGVFGGEGAVLSVERYEWQSEAYLVIRCRKDQLKDGEDGQPVPFPSSFYVRVCSLQRGWCSDELYTKEVLYGGETMEAEVEVVDGKIIIREAGEEHIGVLP